MKQKSKSKILGIVATAVIALSMTACTTTETETGDINVGEVSSEMVDLTAKMQYQKAEDPGTVTTQNLDITGKNGYVQLTDLARSSFIRNSFAYTTLDLADGSVVVVELTSSDIGISLHFIHLDTATGALIDTAFCELPNVFNDETGVQWQIITGKEVYPEEMDLMIQTSKGAYLFDLDDLSKDPLAYTYGTDEFGDLFVTDLDGMINSVAYANKVYDIQNNRILYANNEGVYLASPDGSESVKIADQPEPRDWFEEYRLKDKPDSETQDAVYAGFRLFDNGTKAVSRIVNFDGGSNYSVGMAIFDLENNTVQNLGYFTSDSPLSKLDNWSTMTSYTISETIGYVDDQTFGIMVGGFDQASPFNQVRWDILVDVNTGSVKKANASPTGITTDYVLEAVSDSYKGSTGKCTIFDMGIDNYSENSGLYITNKALCDPIGISSKYALYNVWMPPARDEEGNTAPSDPSSGQFYLIPVAPEKSE